jgi:hypothetical protein
MYLGFFGSYVVPGKKTWVENGGTNEHMLLLIKVQESVMRNRCGGLPVSASACISGAFPLFFLLFSA